MKSKFRTKMDLVAKFRYQSEKNTYTKMKLIHKFRAKNYIMTFNIKTPYLNMYFELKPKSSSHVSESQTTDNFPVIFPPNFKTSQLHFKTLTPLNRQNPKKTKTYINGAYRRRKKASGS